MTLNIDPEMLYAQIPSLRANRVLKMDWDQFGAAMNLEVQGRGATAAARRQPSDASAPPVDYWTSVKREMTQLLCTKSKTYSKLRRQLSSAGTTATLSILSTLSGWLAATLSVPVLVITPLVGVVLLAIATVGLNAWCEIQPKTAS